MKRIILISLIIIMCILASSCDLIDIEKLEMPTEKPVVDIEDYSEVLDKGPETGGVLTIASTRYETLNPLFNENYFMKDVLGLIFEGLVTLDTDYRPVPLLCESFGSTPDSLTWTFNLKKGVKWHDGTNFTAYDVEFTINTLKEAQKSYYKGCVKNISSVNVVDSNTIIINCTTPDSFTAAQMYFPIIPRHRYSNGIGDLKSTVNNTPVGTGMYKFESANQNKMTLKINEGWHGEKKPYITGVQVDFYNSLNSLINSKADIISVKSEDIEKGIGKIGYGVKKLISSEFEFFAMNNVDNCFVEPAVRNAIALALNKDMNVKKVIGEGGVSCDLPVFPESWINPANTSYYPANVSKAIKLLEDNGWTKKNNKWHKVVNGNGTYLDFKCIVNELDTDRVKLAEFFSEELKKIGVFMTVVKEKQEKILESINNGTYQAAILGMNVPGLGDLSMFYVTGNKPTNVTSYSNPTVDALFGQLMANSFENERKDLFSSIKQNIVADVPFVGLYFKENAIFYSKRIKGIAESKPVRENRLRDIENWYIPGSSSGQVKNDNK